MRERHTIITAFRGEKQDIYVIASCLDKDPIIIRHSIARLSNSIIRDIVSMSANMVDFGVVTVAVDVV